jgi:Contractile injection system tube protein/LysM domain
MTEPEKKPKPSKTTNAYLEFTEALSGGDSIIFFDFNPKELSVTKKANWKSTPSKKDKAPPPEYNGPEAASMNLEMFIDASEDDNGDVSKLVDQLIEACTPTSSSEKNNKPKPPGVKFAWGQKTYLTGYMESVSAKYTLFRKGGRPVRAVCTIALKEFPKNAGKQNPTSGALTTYGSTRVVEGDTLAGIAYREYGDPGLWRAIADVNNIDDPMRVPAGTRLLIPAPTDADRYR